VNDIEFSGRDQTWNDNVSICVRILKQINNFFWKLDKTI